MHASATTENTPNNDISAKSRTVGSTQTNGVVAAPNSRVAAICPATSTVFEVARNMRVVTSEAAKQMLPVSAISAASVKLAADGRNASSTPAKPTSTAVQRRQPTCSRSSTTESAVTSIGTAR